MPFVSAAQRRALWAKDPRVAREFEDATPKGKKLPERLHPKKKTVKHAYFSGVDSALSHFGFKTAASVECRKSIVPKNNNPFHGVQRALSDAAKQADEINPPLEPQGDPESPVERFTEEIQALPDPQGVISDDTKPQRMERSTTWGAPTNPAGGNTGVDMGQNTQSGQVF